MSIIRPLPIIKLLLRFHTTIIHLQRVHPAIRPIPIQSPWVTRPLTMGTILRTTDTGIILLMANIPHITTRTTRPTAPLIADQCMVTRLTRECTLLINHLHIRNISNTSIILFHRP